METRDRQQLLTSYNEAYHRLVDALRQFPQEMWQFKPSPQEWSIHELIIHLADAEANGYIRIRKCIAEQDQTIWVYDGPGWSETLNYLNQPVALALELFHQLRNTSWMLLKSVDEAAWTRTIQHPERGRLTLEDLLEIYESHPSEHIEQMWTVYRTWVEHHW